MNYVDVKFIGLLSSRLEHFKKKTNTLYNFRCPVCGDSEKNRYKARGYLYPGKDRSGFIFKCHNCGDTRSLGNLIKYIDHSLYQKYLLEGYGKKDKRFISKQEVRRKSQQLDSSFLEKTLAAERVDKIPKDSPDVVHAFINNRQIPDSELNRLYYIDDDKILENLGPEYKGRIHGNQARVILPFYDRDNVLVGLTARAIDESVGMRYLAFRLDKDAPMIFGLEKIKRNSRNPVYVVEGPIDSLFLPNTVAVGGSDFGKLTQEVRKNKCIIIFDNEPRNVEIVKKMKTIINDGYKICVWPQNINEKDINDMVIAGKTPDEILKVINTNTFSGLKAMATFNEWKRVNI